jgi:two-component system sensor histidine kinase RegB
MTAAELNPLTGKVRSTAVLQRLFAYDPRLSDTSASSEDATGRKNLLQLIQLRWLAVAGQVVTIATVSLAFHIALPLAQMAGLLLFLLGLNLVGHLRLRARNSVSNGELFLALALDMAALTGQLYLSGGATNPFISLYLLQIILGAVLLQAWSTWTLVALAAICFAGLTAAYVPLELPIESASDLFDLHIAGSLICFLIDTVLLVVFIGRITLNLRIRDAHLADLKRHAVEEDHIVRMGLLASGAAHELGTPLATLSVILNDWRRMPVLRADPDLIAEIEDMEGEVRRCKAILTGILLSAGEARGEGPVVASVRDFLHEIVADWRASHPDLAVSYRNSLRSELRIVSDAALRQIVLNVLDNAAEASPDAVAFAAEREGDDVVLRITDQGPGFAPEILDNFGRPYQSTKGRAGGGLGLFLVVNVVRKLGGSVSARNRDVGAEVTLRLPLSALAMAEKTPMTSEMADGD